MTAKKKTTKKPAKKPAQKKEPKKLAAPTVGAVYQEKRSGFENHKVKVVKLVRATQKAECMNVESGRKTIISWRTFATSWQLSATSDGEG